MWLKNNTGVSLNEKIHFMGVGGIGVSALAKFAIQKGAIVTGSDLQKNDRTRELSRLGAGIYIGQEDATQERPDRVVFSSAIPDDNPELIAFKSQGVPLIHRSELLAEYINQFQGIAVAGTHGKTTTSSLLYHILAQAGKQPSALLGGELVRERTNSIIGRSDLLVAEADESDGTFVRLKPQTAVITSIDADVNVTAQAYEECGYSAEKALEVVTGLFSEFAGNTRGRVIACLDHPNVRTAIPHWKGDILTYGESPEADLYAKILSFQNYQVMAEVYLHGKSVGGVFVPLPGQHNLLNALAAVAGAAEHGVPVEEALKHVTSFFGVRRRFEIVGRTEGKIYVDDYAHNPQKIKAAITGAKRGHVNRVIAVFQPHRYTRTKLLQQDYPESFSDADLVLVTDIYASGEQPMPGVSAEALTRAINQVTPARYTPGLREVTQALQDIAQPGDLIIGLGAGSVGQWIRRISRWDKTDTRWVA